MTLFEILLTILTTCIVLALIVALGSGDGRRCPAGYDENEPVVDNKKGGRPWL